MSLKKSASRGDGEPIKIIVCQKDSGFPIGLNVKGLRDVLLQDSVKDKPIVVFSIAGSYRTGKSFLLNLMIRYLKAKHEGVPDDKWLQDKETILDGFKWEMGADRCTEGILLWSRPFIITDHSGREIAVLLMDTQGLFDEKTDPEHGNAMITLSTLFSSIQVYNVRCNIEEQQLQAFEVFIEAGLMLSGERIGQGDLGPFQRLVFLVRDWQGVRKHKYGETGGRTLLQEKLQSRMDQSERQQRTRDNIRSCFQTLECFLMPYPGRDAAIEKDEDYEVFAGKVKDLDPDFVSKLQELAPFFFGPGRAMTKKCGSEEVTGEALFGLILRYTSLFEDGSVPMPSSTRQLLIEQFNSMVIDKIMKAHGQRIIEDIHCEKLDVTRAELDTIIAEEEKSSFQKFLAEFRGVQDELKVFREKLESRFKSRKELMQAKNCERIAKQMKRWKEECSKQLYKAKFDYRKEMDQILQGRSLADQTLHKYHQSTTKKIMDSFKEATSGYKPENAMYIDDLQEFFEERLSIYIRENEKKEEVEKQQEEICWLAVDKAKDAYTEQMEEVYDIGRMPTAESKLEEFSTSCFTDAVEEFKRKITSLDIEDMNTYIEDIKRFCKRKCEKFKKKNKFNLQRQQDEDKYVFGRGFFEARMVYREYMGKRCFVGGCYHSEEQMQSLHENGVGEAKAFFESSTSEATTRKPIRWDAGVKESCESEMDRFNNINQLNNPDRIPPKKVVNNLLLDMSEA